MKSKLILSLAVVLGLALVAAVAAEKNVWISDDGERHDVHGNMMFIGEDGEAFDLSDLADGETRVFGTGDKQVTATRNGDVATIQRPASGDEPELEITCRLSQDTCKVMTVADDSEKVMIMIQKTRECVDGEGDCEQDCDLLDVGALGGDARTIMVRTTVECDDDGNCTEDVSQTGHPHGSVVFVSGAGDDKISLRCPEGDTTMRVEKTEAEDVFLCPKHSVPLEKVESKGRVHEIKVHKKEKSREY